MVGYIVDDWQSTAGVLSYRWDQAAGTVSSFNVFQNYTFQNYTQLVTTPVTPELERRDPSLDVRFAREIERQLCLLPEAGALRVRRRILAARTSRILQIDDPSLPERMPERVRERVQSRGAWGFEHRQRCRTGRPRRERYVAE